MSTKKFEPHCPGCRPVMIDANTGEQLPDSDPLMQVMIGAYDRLTPAEKESFHAVHVLNSRDPKDLQVVARLAYVVKKAAELMEGNPNN